MVSLESLDRMEAFQGIDDEQLDAVRPYCEEFVFQRGDKLFMEGEEATHLWLVIEGDVDLRFEMPDRETSVDSTISTINVDRKSAVAKTLGWSCFVPPHKMRLSCYCVSRHCKVIKIPSSALRKIFDEYPELGYRFMAYIVKVVGYRFHQFQDEVAKKRGDYLMTGW